MRATGVGVVDRAGKRTVQWAGAVVTFIVGCLIAGAALPGGLPFGIVLQGLVIGALSSLTAMGLVILYRSARIINFAQVEMGGLSASFAVLFVTGWHIPYLIALPVGLLISLATGALIDLTVVRTLFQAPRLILTVATIGLAQVLGATELAVPGIFGHLKPLSNFSTPFHLSWKVGPAPFNGDYLFASIVIPVVLMGLAWFFGRTSFGIAIRGSADSTDRALLLGIPVRRLSTITWMLAAGLSGIAAMLSAPILGPQLGVLAGPIELLPPLAAAVIARMESLTVAFAASLFIGVFEEAVLWSYTRGTAVDVALFGVVLVALLLQRKRIRRVDDDDLGSYVALREVRPIPAVLRRLPEVRIGRVVIGLAVLAGAILWPWHASVTGQINATYIAIYGIIAVSLVMLIGWSGQISLGQFAFAGIGAGTTASLFVEAHADLFVALFFGALAGALAAVLIGIPAVRLSGLFLAVSTMAFAVPVSDYLLNSAYFPSFAPSTLIRPYVLKRFNLGSDLTFYYFCLLFLGLALLIGWNYRRARPGRTAVAVRDNARGAAAFGISPIRSKLTAYAIAGALAGVAGGLYAVGLQGIPFSGFSPQASVDVFIMVVVGGLGSLTGGVVGAIYLEMVQNYLHGAWQFLATGGGVLLVVQLFPSGLSGDIIYRLRDIILRRLAAFRGLSVPSLAEKAAFATEDAGAVPLDGDSTTELEVPVQSGHLLDLQGVDAGYGQVQVLFGVNLGVRDGEIAGLLGTNGAGKSTVLKVASGLIKPKRGHVIFDGRNLAKVGPVDRVRMGLVTVPSGRSVFPSLTVAENLRLGSWLIRHQPEVVESTTQWIFQLFPALEDRQDVPAGMLSGGEQQMLSIAQSLYCQPRLLLIDELSLGLAPAVVAHLLEVVRQLAASGVTVVVVEQSLNLATSIARRAVFMERGQVRFSGNTADLAAKGDLVRAVFLGSARQELAKHSHPHQPAVSVGARTVFAVEEVTRQFGGVTALDEVSFEVREGEILGIIGANGAGKTTLFDICSGFLTPTRGRVRLGPYDITGRPPQERSELGLGRVFQDARLFPSLTVTDTIAVALERHLEVRDPVLSILRTGAVARSEEDAAGQVQALIERFGLDRYRDAFVSELSTGTRRVVELACVLAHDPSVLLLDEPTSGIAQREGEALGQLILDLRAQTGGTFVIIEHDVPLVASMSDRLICLHLGRVVAEGPPDQVLADPAVIEAYLGTDTAAIQRSGRRKPLRARAASTRQSSASTTGNGRTTRTAAKATAVPTKRATANGTTKTTRATTARAGTATARPAKKATTAGRNKT